MKRIAVLLAGLLLIPAAAEAASTSHSHPFRGAGPNPTARASALYLTVGEAKREIRGRARRDAREDGARLEYIEVSDCLRYSPRRIRCYVYREESDGYACEGEMQVIEFRSFYRTQGIGTRCS